MPEKQKSVPAPRWRTRLLGCLSCSTVEHKAVQLSCMFDAQCVSILTISPTPPRMKVPGAWAERPGAALGRRCLHGGAVGHAAPAVAH
eukprot:353069-Chlamydomonas_euryale.AAC.3